MHILAKIAILKQYITHQLKAFEKQSRRTNGINEVQVLQNSYKCN